MEGAAPAVITFDESLVTTEWVDAFSKKLEAASWTGPEALKPILSQKLLCQILERVTALCKAESTLVEVKPKDQDASVVVVGDTHGQLHDVLEMLKRAGNPSEKKFYVFNGDFVDRGAWGLEVLLVLAAWKLALPARVTLLRGNHETTTCTMMYGFRAELERKYGKTDLKPIYAACKRLFAVLPLAACIGSATLVLHGGLYRKPVAPPPASKGKRKRKSPTALNAPCEIGSLEDLRGCSKGGADPNGRGSTVVATDVLWSDPVATPGMMLNDGRGVGVIFGPDVTQKFLEDNKLKLILRSHEGPDARFERDDMASMAEGWTEDHISPAGRLLTVFSAPDYPQFQSDDVPRYNNKAAVAVLRAPSWASPTMVQYEAVLPRPAASAFYDFMDVVGSDEEIDILGSDASQAASVAASEASFGAPSCVEGGQEATSGAHHPHGNGVPEPEPPASGSAAGSDVASGSEQAGALTPPVPQVADGQKTAGSTDRKARVMEDPSGQGASTAEQPGALAPSAMDLSAGPATDGLDAAAGHLLATACTPPGTVRLEGTKLSQEEVCEAAEPAGPGLTTRPLECANPSSAQKSEPAAEHCGVDGRDTAEDVADAGVEQTGEAGAPAERASVPGQRSSVKAGSERVGKQPKPWRP